MPSVGRSTTKVQKMPPRGLILAAGALTATGTGCIYMWSIFNKPLMDAFGFTTSEVSMAYSLFLLATCFAGWLAGWLQRRVESRFIVLGGGIIFGIGWFGSGFADNLAMLYIFFGGFAGAGNGFLYNTIVSVVTKWYPDKRGLANGVCIGAIGLGPVVFSLGGNYLIETFDVQMAFRIVGLIWMAVYLIFSWILYVPPSGWMPSNASSPVQEAGQSFSAEAPTSENAPSSTKNTGGVYEPEATSKTAARKEEMHLEEPAPEVNMQASQMVKQPLFYFLFLTLMVASTSGLMVTGHASNIGQELAHLTASEGAIMVSVMAFGSFLGRFGFGFLSDFIGRYNALIIALALNTLVMFFFLGQATTFISFLVAISLVGACFGGALSVIPAMVGDAFGSADFGQNYSLVYPGYTVAAFVGPMAASYAIEAAGTYVLSFSVAGTISAVGIVVVFIAKKLAARLKEQACASAASSL